MSVKQDIISLLEANRNKAVSGQELANQLSVSRAAVWKAVKALEDEGYNIEATTNKGYILLENSDVLSSESILYYLNQDINIHTYKTIDSTNIQLKKMAIDGSEDHTVIVAEEQSDGRGRFGRSFYSPAKQGIYMSVLLRTNELVQDATIITIQSAVAIYRAIKKLYGIEVEIKWVNDLFYQGKKICGILSEAISDFESGMIEAVIVGMGINVTTSSFPAELKDIATSLGLQDVNRNQFVAEILKQLFAIKDEDFKLVLSEYKKASCVLHKEIEFNQNVKVFMGYVKEINELGNLVIDYNNQELILSSGEVKIIGGLNGTK